MTEVEKLGERVNLLEEQMKLKEKVDELEKEIKPIRDKREQKEHRRLFCGELEWLCGNVANLYYP